MPWQIVETKAMAEEVAERSLRNAGYRVYLPRFRKLVSPHGAQRASQPVLRPVFSRVLFVQHWRGWPTTPIVGTIGLMHIGRKPAELSDADVRALLERELAGDFDQIANGVRTDIAIGDQVQAQRFGHEIVGVLESLSEAGKATISALMFGGQVTIQVSASSISRRSGT